MVGGDTFEANGRRYRAPRDPILAVCADGWDPEYVDDALERELMPRVSDALGNGGTYTLARAQMPTFTNPNNVAIVTGVNAAHNGVAGNHYLDAAGNEVQVIDPSFLRATTIHAAAVAAGIPALCVTAKDKLRRLLATGGVPAYSAELAHEQTLPDGTPITDVAGGENPGVYDWRLSPYTIELALALGRRLGSRLVYASLTDYVQHAAAPGGPLADEFYGAVDVSLGRALDAGFVVGLVADHGMRAKVDRDGAPSVRYLDEVLAGAGVSGRTLCPITDPYVVHHAALGSLAWVHLADQADRVRARGALAAPGRRRARRGRRQPRPTVAAPRTGPRAERRRRSAHGRVRRAGPSHLGGIRAVSQGHRSRGRARCRRIPFRCHGGAARRRRDVCRRRLRARS